MGLLLIKDYRFKKSKDEDSLLNMNELGNVEKII